MGFKMVEVESDATQVIEDLQNKGDITGCGALHKRLRRLMKQNWLARFKHIYREGNRCADLLARLGNGKPFQKHVWPKPPKEAAEILQQDAAGVIVPRRVLM